MKKIKLILAVLLAAMCFTNVNATVTITPPEKPEVMNEELVVGNYYYLYNVGCEKFMNRHQSDGYYAGWSETAYALRLDNSSDGYYTFWQGNYYIGDYYDNVGWDYSTDVNNTYVKFDLQKNDDGTYKLVYTHNFACTIGYTGNSYVPCGATDDNANWILAPQTDDEKCFTYLYKNKLYNAIVAADAKGYHVERYEDIYNDETKSYSDYNNAANELNNGSSLSETHSYLFPEWNDYPILITSLGNWSRYYSENYLWRETYRGKGTTNTLKASVYVDQPSTLSFIMDCNQRWQNEPTMPFQVVVDGELTYDYKGETNSYYYDTRFDVLHNYRDSYYYDPYREYYNYNIYNIAYNRYFINLEPGHHLVDIITTQNYDGDYFDTHFYQIGVEKTPTIEVNLAKVGSLGDEVLRAMDNNPLIEKTNIRNTRRLKISGKMGDADFDEIYNMTELYYLDLTDAEITEIKTGQLSQYYHNSLSNLHELKLPKNLKTIGQEAFFVTYIDSVDIPETVTSIGDFAFSNTRLREANIPNVTTIGHNAFRGCTMLNKVVMKNVESMGINAFAECYNLKEVEFDGTLTTVPQRTFNACDEIERISIPESVTKIELAAFYWNEKSTLSKLPENLQTVESNAFYENYYATFELPKSLKTIGSSAFKDCDRMYGDIPSSVTSFGSGAFANTNCLNMPDTLHLSPKASYGANLFQYSKLKNVVIPEDFYNFNVSKAFANCDSLKSIKLLSSTKVSVPTDFVYGLTKKNIKILVPDYLRTTYMRDSYWMDFTIEGFPTTEMDSVVIRQNLALSQHDRFEGTPDLAIEKGVIFELEGVAGMDLNNVTLNSDLEANSFAQIVSGTDQVSVGGLTSERLYTKANKWYFISLPFDCNLASTVNENGAKYAIRYYDGASRARAIDRTLYPYPESAHDYSAYLDENSSGNKQTFTYTDANKLLISFSSKCKVQDGPSNDLIHIRDGNGNETTYDNTELANAEIVIDGNTFDIWITSDGWGIQGYGYSIDYIYPDPEEGVNYRTWKNYNVSTDIIPAGTGFIFMTSQDSWTRFYSVNNGTKNRVFENSENENNEFHYELQKHPSENAANRGWNLVGNPYPNYYNNHKISFAAPITLWDGTTYKAYSLRDDDIAIKPNQAIFVQCPEDVAEISFPAAGRQTTSVISDQANARPYAAENSNRQIIDLALTNGTYTDDTRVVINPEASLGYEVGCDAGKFMSMDNSVQQLYTLDAANNRYAINERPIAEGNVALGTYFPASGTYTFSLKRNQAARVMLTDNEIGFTHDLTADDYTFTAQAGDANARFVLTIIADETTNIDAVAGTSTTADAATYTIGGIRMDKVSKAGVYIINGKKVVK